MATRVETFDISTPAGTTAAAPQTTTLAVPRGRLDRLELTIPAGHAGLTGFALFHSSAQVIPKTVGAFLRGNDRVIGWDLSRYPTGSKWTVRTYNLDVFAHSHLIDLLFTDEMPEQGPLTPAPVLVVPDATPDELGDSEQLPDDFPDEGDEGGQLQPAPAGPDVFDEQPPAPPGTRGTDEPAQPVPWSERPPAAPIPGKR